MPYNEGSSLVVIYKSPEFVSIKMAKEKILKKQKKSTKDLLIPYNFNPKIFQDNQLVREVLLESLSMGDLDSFRDVLIAYLKAQSMTEFSKKSGIGRQTIYDMLKKPKDFDPQASTIAKIMTALAA